MSNRVLTAPPHAEPLVGFRSRKAAQLCVWFALSNNDARIEKLKLIKLIYLCEREHLDRFDESMLLDELYSLPHGPICSSTLNGINGIIHNEVWDDYVTRNGNIIMPVRNFDRDSLDDLSDEDLDLAGAVWAKFGHMTASQIRNYTHLHCPEYTELEVGRLPISYRDVLVALGSDRALELEQEMASLRQAEKLLTKNY